MDFRKFSVGLTGGIGSGKTFVANMFESLGASIVDTDKVAHSLTAPGGDGIELIRQVFGAEFIDSNGALNRSKMRDFVFSNADNRLKLEAILHPMIRDVSFQLAEKAQGDYVIFVNPLLIELPIWKGMGTRIMVIDCSEQVQVSRVIERSHLSEEQVLSIIRTQATRQKRLAVANDVIVNDRSEEEIYQEVKRWHERYLDISKRYA